MKTLLLGLLAIVKAVRYEIFITKMDLVDSKYPLKKIEAKPGFIGLNEKDFYLTYTHEDKQMEQPFPYLNALDDDGSFLGDPPTVIQTLRNKRLEKLALIVERYHGKIEESLNTCGVLSIHNLQKVAKAQPDNPANLTMFYYCGRNLEELKEVDNKITIHFDEVLKKAQFMEYPLPMLGSHYKVKLALDGEDFDKEDSWAYPLATTMAFFKEHETPTDTINTNRGFLYSQITDCKINRIATGDNIDCLSFQVSYGFQLYQDYILCNLDDKIRLLKTFSNQLQKLMNVQCNAMKGVEVKGKALQKAKEIVPPKKKEPQEKQDTAKALEKLMDSKPIPKTPEQKQEEANKEAQEMVKEEVKEEEKKEEHKKEEQDKNKNDQQEKEGGQDEGEAGQDEGEDDDDGADGDEEKKLEEEKEKLKQAQKELKEIKQKEEEQKADKEEGGAEEVAEVAEALDEEAIEKKDKADQVKKRKKDQEKKDKIQEAQQDKEKAKEDLEKEIEQTAKEEEQKEKEKEKEQEKEAEKEKIPIDKGTPQEEPELPEDPVEIPPQPPTPPEKGSKNKKPQGDTPATSPSAGTPAPKGKTPKGKMKDKLKAAAGEVYGHNQQIREVFDNPISGEEQETKDEHDTKHKNKKQLECNAGLPGLNDKKLKQDKKNMKLTKEQMVEELEKDKQLRVFIQKFNEDITCETAARQHHLKISHQQ